LSFVEDDPQLTVLTSKFNAIWTTIPAAKVGTSSFGDPRFAKACKVPYTMQRCAVEVIDR